MPEDALDPPPETADRPETAGPPKTPDVPASVRAQLLATEHWSLLASRSTTQGEVLTRISIFLTLTSATLLSIALVGQATDFNDTFRVFLVAVLAILALIGVLTGVRVSNVAHEDLMYVLAMNRLRAAYLEIDPSLAPYFMASPFDDRAGSVRTYFWLGRRSDFGQVAGSSMIFIAAVTGVVIGLLAAAIAGIFDAPTFVLYLVGFAAGLAYFIAAFVLGARGYFSLWKTYQPYAPTPPVPPVM